MKIPKSAYFYFFYLGIHWTNISFTFQLAPDKNSSY